MVDAINYQNRLLWVANFLSPYIGDVGPEKDLSYAEEFCRRILPLFLETGKVKSFTKHVSICVGDEIIDDVIKVCKDNGIKFTKRFVHSSDELLIKKEDQNLFHLTAHKGTIEEDIDIEKLIKEYAVWEKTL